jgi:general stress protein 26
MTLAHTRDTKRLWLLSGILGDSLDDLRADPHVNVVMQDGLRFCSISGLARVARPDGEARWSETERAWMQGARRSNLVLIEVTPHYAEYWDRSGVNGLKFDATGAKAAVDGAAAGRSADALAAAVAGMTDNVILLERRRRKR